MTDTLGRLRAVSADRYTVERKLGRAGTALISTLLTPPHIILFRDLRALAV